MFESVFLFIAGLLLMAPRHSGFQGAGGNLVRGQVDRALPWGLLAQRGGGDRLADVVRAKEQLRVEADIGDGASYFLRLADPVLGGASPAAAIDRHAGRACGAVPQL
ncbi:hypothetical protein [Thalassobaculum sp.]|uniref:hypothetical protein n=1 Tax=Thalassobaculum sp. TaxID=2022740 RepID=UPI0032ECE41A